jgi:hypothetical protein
VSEIATKAHETPSLTEGRNQIDVAALLQKTNVETPHNDSSDSESEEFYRVGKFRNVLPSVM